MKKIITILIFILSVFIVGCAGDSFDNYLDKVSLPSEVTEDFNLPGTINTKGNHDMYWTSADSSSIKVGNYFEQEGLFYYHAYVTRSNVDKEIKLTLKLEVNNLGSIEKEYIVKVKKIEKVEEETVELTFYALNDFHGSVINDYGGLSVIGSYLMKQKEEKPDSTIILSSGDMFQGSALSNMTQGKVIVECMNKIGFDAMTVGNHEFDWGTDVIKGYHDKTSEVKPTFPILGANITVKETGDDVDWTDPYTIVERNGIKIGIIGVIGSSLESSISPTIVAPYEFVDTIPVIKKYTKYLRTEQNCDIVVVSAHDNTLGINQSIADLSGEYQVDAIFNGHTHTTYAGETRGSDNYLLPYVQSGSVGKNIGKIVLKYNKKTKTLIEGSAENISVSLSLASPNQELNAIINKYNDEVVKISGQVIGVAGTYIEQFTCAKWAANVLKTEGHVQIGFINSGGIRSNAFPIEVNQEITIGKVWEIMPFDNEVKTCMMSVKDIIRLYDSGGIIHSSNINVKNNVLYVDGVKANDDDKFLVGAVDYIFDKEEYPFLSSDDIRVTGDLFRDYLINSITNTCKDGSKWMA